MFAPVIVPVHVIVIMWYILLLPVVEDTLLSTDQMEQAAFLSLCQGDVEGALQAAVSKNSLTDSLVNSASMCE